MKRIIVSVVLIITVGTIASGKYYWDQQQKDTVNKARTVLAAENPQARSTTNVREKDQAKKTAQKSDSKTKAAVNKEAGDTAKKPKNSPETQKKSLKEIKAYYDNLFNELEKQTASQSDQLLVQAKADQVSGKYSKVKLAAKYEGLAKQLQQNTDKTFNSLYEKVQYDLADNGYDVDEAADYRTSYNKKKKEQTAKMLKQVNNF